MRRSGTTDWETTLDLPLAAIGEQVRRIESQLRAVEVAATGIPIGALAREAERAVATRLEALRTTLDTLDQLVRDVERHVANPHALRSTSDDHREYVRRTRSGSLED